MSPDSLISKNITSSNNIGLNVITYWLRQAFVHLFAMFVHTYLRGECAF